MIDLHCHILPGVDDGPATMADALAIARAAVEMGTTTIVATPHVSWDWPRNSSQSIETGVAAVNAALRDAAVDLQVCAGAEIAMTRVDGLDDEELHGLRLGNGHHLLVECPYSPTAAGFSAVLDSLRVRGHGIVLAHPERCPAFHRDRALLSRFVAEGMLCSITAGSLVGRFGRNVQSFAIGLLTDGLAHNVASDAHSPTERPPGIGTELHSAGFGERADWLARAVPRAVLEGTPIPPPPSPRSRRRGLFSWARAFC